MRSFYPYCQLAGKDNIKCGGVLQNMHIETRGVIALRYNPMNCIVGCAGHHVYYTYHPNDWDRLVKKYFPEQWKFKEKHRNDEAHFKLSDYQELLINLQERKI